MTAEKLRNKEIPKRNIYKSAWEGDIDKIS